MSVISGCTAGKRGEKNCWWEKEKQRNLGGRERYVEEDREGRRCCRGGNCCEVVDSELYPVWLMQSVRALWSVGCDSNGSSAGLTKSGLGLIAGHTSSPAAFNTHIVMHGIWKPHNLMLFVRNNSKNLWNSMSSSQSSYAHIYLCKCAKLYTVHQCNNCVTFESIVHAACIFVAPGKLNV